MAFLGFPHNLRSISRILMAIVILVSAGFVWYKNLNFVQNLNSRSARNKYLQKQQLPEVLGSGEQVKGVDIFLEIERTRRVLERRPDYAAAWLRLAVLYEQIGEVQLAGEARDYAGRLNPDLSP